MCPVRKKSPLDEVEFVMDSHVPDCCYELTWGNIIPWLNIREFLQVECFSKYLRADVESESAAHVCIPLAGGTIELISLAE
jgi:hypothetical protein